MVSASLARRLSSSTTFSLPGRISYWACQPASGFTPMRANSWRRAFSFGDRPSAAALPRLAGSLSLLLEPLVGRSRMWPILDFTTYWLPRYLLMVLALAGDSTMTSDLPMGWRIPDSKDELRGFIPQPEYRARNTGHRRKTKQRVGAAIEAFRASKILSTHRKIRWQHGCPASLVLLGTE